MVRKCCVPGCTSNYGKETTYTTVFYFPKEETRRALWVRSINRDNFNPSSTSVICVNHFSEHFIIREDRVTRDDGSLLVVPRKKLALTSDAYPTIFPNQPSYLTKQLLPKRKPPSERSQEMVARDEKKFAQWCLGDNITSFEQFKSKYCSKLHSGWQTLNSEDFILFYKIQESGCPKITVSLKILNDLTIVIWHGDTPIDSKSFEWVLGPSRKCDKWTKFDCLLNLLVSYEVKGMSIDQKLSAAAHFLKECCDTEEEGNEDRDFKLKLGFLQEQVSLMRIKQLRYSSDLLLWACKLYFCYPASYNLIRSSGVLTLPHPCYLKKLSASLKCTSTTRDSHHILYLKKKAELLSEHEKIVNVLDEIYVAPEISYKGGHLVGFSTNTNTEATTIQTFMITSLLAKNKDIVALIPVKNLTAGTLHSYTLRVLQILTHCGYSVLSVISDNNRINRNMFTLMCGGHLKSFIANPVNEATKLFFLFDTVHLIKSVRNNWLNQAKPDQNFYYPHPEDFSKICRASVLHLVKIYEAERNLVIKQAPKLLQKVLFPTSTERQNVSHALNLFHQTNVVALETNCEKFGNELGETKKFIEIILKWWSIVNVKHQQKGMLQRNKSCEPIKDVSEDNVVFLKHFSSWLSAWEKLSQLPAQEKSILGIPTKGGMLSKETQFALKFTTDSLIDIIDHIFKAIGPSYVLLGKFQTDSLEARFGQYRQMSGGNYNISCRQILESERKLRLLSLIDLHSEKLGSFQVKSLECVDSDNCISECNNIPEGFYEIFNSYDDVEVADSMFSVLIYIAGYVAHRVYQNVNCKDCFLILACDKGLEYKTSCEDVVRYLQLTDRGGLKWPREFTVQLVLQTFQVFQKLIGEKYEELFLRHGQQKHLIVQLTLEKLDLMNFILNEKCKCGTECIVLAKKCLSVVANILLNNYTKVRNDRQKNTNSKRKLATLMSS